MRVPIALTIAGSDPSGGAGIQADLKTFSALGVYGASVIAALTAQNTRGVTALHVPPPAFLAAQIDAVLTDLDVGAVKIGMLAESASVETVAERLAAHGVTTIVLDPVMVAKSGAKLLRDDAVRALAGRLVPMALVLTPNLPEAAVLLGASEGDVAANREDACRGLLALGARAVVLKGGHMEGPESEDLFTEGGTIERLSAPRIETANTHGTGCTFSSAIAAFLARGAPLAEAVRSAKRYVTGAIEAGAQLRVGRGHGPVHHFFGLWEQGPGDRVG